MTEVHSREDRGREPLCDLRALTFIAPMGQAIVMDHPFAKRVENRPRSLPRKMRVVPSVVAVHCGLKWRDDYADTVSRITGITVLDNLPGHVVGLMRLSGRQFTSAEEASSPWWSGPFGYEISDAVRLDRPVALQGAQGWFRVTLRAAGLILSQVADSWHPAWYLPFPGAPGRADA